MLLYALTLMQRRFLAPSVHPATRTLILRIKYNKMCATHIYSTTVYTFAFPPCTTLIKLAPLLSSDTVRVMALFERSDDVRPDFPTEPAYIVPVKVCDTPHYGKGHKGVFSLAPIRAGTKFWIWTDRVIQIHHSDLQEYIAENFDTEEEVKLFLRQGFVLPNNVDFFNSNPTDAGRFMNHSAKPNCGPDGTLRDIAEGEELTLDYTFHGNPVWYQAICQKYGVPTEADVAATCHLYSTPEQEKSQTNAAIDETEV